MTTGGKRIPIHIKVTNIENPTDTVDYNSIHSAMKKYKRSFQTIKNYISNNNPINGYMWTQSNSERLSSIDTQSEVNSDIISDIHSESESEFTCEVDNDYLQDEPELDQTGTPREYIILPLHPIIEELQTLPPIPPLPQPQAPQISVNTKMHHSQNPKPREQCICSIM
jgi:hypothetical protein